MGLEFGQWDFLVFFLFLDSTIFTKKKKKIQPYSPSGCSKIHPRGNQHVYSVNRRLLTQQTYLPLPGPTPAHVAQPLVYIRKAHSYFNKHPPTTRNQNVHFSLTFPVIIFRSSSFNTKPQFTGTKRKQKCKQFRFRRVWILTN